MPGSISNSLTLMLDDEAGGFTVNVLLTAFPPKATVIVAVVVVVTEVVVTLKFPLIAPPAIKTEAGTAAAGLLDESITLSPPLGAGADNVTIPFAVVPPVTDEGEIVTPVSTGT